MSAPAQPTVDRELAQLIDRARAAHDRRIVLPEIRTFWLEPQCHELGCPCHTPPGAQPKPDAEAFA